MVSKNKYITAFSMKRYIKLRKEKLRKINKLMKLDCCRYCDLVKLKLSHIKLIEFTQDPIRK